MRRMTTSFGIAALGLALALGAGTACSRQDRQEVKKETGEAAAQVGAAAEKAAGKVGEMAEGAADKAGEMAGKAADKMGMGDDPVERCQNLAAEGKWAEALEPCTKAHELRPNDMAIEHAMQQAQAAARE